MFSIIISEKGGAERRESFDKNEINVGRVQGNDLMLPKGNVSKHHARLLYRDGRFIVTDLKSTNGTYVNGRKIAQATIVREGDKIYIGDFVIRLEGQEGAAAGEMPPAMEDESIRTLAREQAPQRPQGNVPAVTLKAPTHPPNAPLPKPMNAVVTSMVAQRPPEPSQPLMSPQPPPLQQPITIPPQPIGERGDGEDNEESSDYRLDDLAADAEDGTPMPKAPARASVAPPPDQPPRPVSAPERPARPHTMPLQAMPSPPVRPGAPPRTTVPPVPAPPPREPAAATITAGGGAAINVGPAREPAREINREPAREVTREPSAPAIPNNLQPNMQTSAPPARTPSTKEQAGRRLALQMLLGRIEDAVDLSPLSESAIVSDSFSQELEKLAKEQAEAMRTEGEAPEGIDLDMLVRDAHQELTRLGIVGSLLDDDAVTEIHVTRYDQVLAVRGGFASPADLAFSSDEALARVIFRLAAESGTDAEKDATVIERAHPRGSLLAVLPPTSQSCVLSFKKRHRIDDKLDDLLRQVRVSKSMGTFLEGAVLGRANILVVGGSTASVSSVVAALAGASGSGERVALLLDTEEVHVPQAHVVALSLSSAPPADVVRAARRMQPSRMVVTELGAAITPSVLEAIADGSQGLIAGMTAPTLRQGVARAAAQVVLARPGVSQEAARDLVAEAFDIAIEVQAMGADNGGGKVSRVSELAGTDPKGVVLRDIFSLTAEGEFQATGVTPKVVADFANRGVKLDVSIFKKK